MLKSEFLSKQWKGHSLVPGVQNQWRNAEGNSLSDCEKQALKGGLIVTHNKSNPFRKLFVMDEQDKLWSIIIKKDDVDKVVSALCEIGFKIS